MSSRTMYRVGMVAAVAALVVMGSCKSTTRPLNPNPAPATAGEANAGTNAGGGQQIGSEGFKEKQLSDAGTGSIQQMPGGVTPEQAAAALKTVYFAYDSDALSDDALHTLESDAAWLNQHPQVRVMLEGHTDERGTVEYNVALGQRRARSVKTQLTRLGVAADRLDTISYGKERPAAEGHDEAAWGKNRRVEFRMVP